MAIGFLSARYIKRSQGHSVIQRLAYLARQRLKAARTGETFDYLKRKDLLIGPVTLLPDGADEGLKDGHALWSAVDAVARADAVLGIDLIVSLPAEVDLALAGDLLEDFLTDIISVHELAVTYVIHAPHVGMTGEELNEDRFSTEGDPFAEAMTTGILNVHAHVLVTPKQIGPGGLAKRRYTLLDPVIQRGRAVDGINWGRLWAIYQNSWLALHGLSLRVRPRAPIASQSFDLKDVRRWRKLKARRNHEAGGRDRLVDPEAEASNRDLLRSIDEGLADVSRPFTRGELLDRYERYLGAEEAAELADAVLGLGGVVELGQFGSRWHATKASVITELAIFGRAAVLAGRTARNRIEPDLHEGTSAAEREMLAAIAQAPDLVLIDAFERPGIVIENLARLGSATGRIVISIAHGAGSVHPKTGKPVLIDVGALGQRRISNGIVIVDHADALVAQDLDRLMQAALVGQCQLVLVRRPGDMWPRSAVLDLATRGALRLTWGRTPNHDSPAKLFRQGEVELALDCLERADRISRVGGAGNAENRAVALAAALLRTGRSAVVLTAADDLRMVLDAKMKAAGLAVEVTNRLPTATPAVIAIPDPRYTRGPMIAAQLGRAEEIDLIVDTKLVPTRADLIDLISLEMPLGIATRSDVAPWSKRDTMAPSPAADSALPRFAVDVDGDITTDPSRIKESVAFWASAPFELIWVGDYALSAGTIMSAIGRNRGSPALAAESFQWDTDLDGEPALSWISTADETEDLVRGPPTEAIDNHDDDPDSNASDEPDFDDDWDDQPSYGDDAAGEPEPES